MTGKTPSDTSATGATGESAAAARRRRKAALLRDNLRKRKAQRRERTPGSTESDPDSPVQRK